MAKEPAPTLDAAKLANPDFARPRTELRTENHHPVVH